jgi:hypothetical protein
MPEGKTREELAVHEGLVRELCARSGFTFTQRLHVIQFGNARGV